MLNKSDKLISRKNNFGLREEFFPWRCRCDYCGRDASRAGDSPGDAADLARKEGFVPVNVGMFDPMKWSCANCKTTMDKNFKNKKK